mgnify:CR=1 FL=1
MPQETTTDMDACQRVQLAQVSWVKNKYSVAALNRLKQDNKDDPQRLQELTASFNAESEAWTELIEKASKSVQVDYAGGTIAGTAVASRQIGLLEFTIPRYLGALATIRGLNSSSFARTKVQI